MTAAQNTAFQAGAGITPATLLTGIASVVLVLAFIWVLWVTWGTFRGLAERAGGSVRCGLEHPARQHRAHGVGILSAMRTVSSSRLGSGTAPDRITGGNPVTSEGQQW